MLEWYRVPRALRKVMEDAAHLLRLACATTGQNLVSWRGGVAVRRAPPTVSPSPKPSSATPGSISFRRCASQPPQRPATAATPNSPSPSRGGDRGGGLDADAASTTSPDRDALAEQLRAQGITVRDGDSWSDLYARVLAAAIEPKLGIGQPQLLIEYPAVEAALARPRRTTPASRSASSSTAAASNWPTASAN